jgi:molecular chaperone DnaJ
MAKKDYYEILGVKKSDSSETIRKAYKKLVLKFHPDKAEADKKKEYEEKFKEINEAFSTLEDDEKRRKYDMGETSHSGQGFSSRGGGGGFEDIINLFRNGGFGGGYDDEDEEDEVGKDLRFRLIIEFKEAVFGCEKEILVERNVPCEECDGTGAEDKEFRSCSNCNGRGRLKVNQKTPFGVISRTIRCESCNGEGQIPENVCSACYGKGVFLNKEKVKVKIPAGIDDGQTLKIRGGGGAVKNGAEGDLFLLINVKSDSVFRREGYDVYIELDVSFSQAALGAELEIPTLSSEKIKIKIDKGTESGKVLRLKGKGVQHLGDAHRHGDQFVNITVRTPKKLSKAQIKLFEELAKLEEN